MGKRPRIGGKRAAGGGSGGRDTGNAADDSPPWWGLSKLDPYIESALLSSTIQPPESAYIRDGQPALIGRKGLTMIHSVPVPAVLHNAVVLYRALSRSVI